MNELDNRQSNIIIGPPGRSKTLVKLNIRRVTFSNVVVADLMDMGSGTNGQSDGNESKDGRKHKNSKECVVERMDDLTKPFESKCGCQMIIMIISKHNQIPLFVH